MGCCFLKRIAESDYKVSSWVVFHFVTNAWSEVGVCLFDLSWFAVQYNKTFLISLVKFWIINLNRFLVKLKILKGLYLEFLKWRFLLPAINYDYHPLPLQTTNATCVSAGEDNIFIGCANGVVRIFDAVNLNYVATMPRPHQLGVDVASALSPR